MIVQIDPSAPWWVHAAAGAALVLHIGGGTVGLASGAVAAVTRKGLPAHRLAGRVYVASMLTMAGAALITAPFLPQRLTALAAAFTLYLVLTGWITVRRRSPGVNAFDIGAFLFALGIVATGIAFALQGQATPNNEIDGQSAPGGYIFAGVAAIAAVSDLVVMLRGGVSGASRTARHLWRMCVALLLAAISLFQGQPQVFPEPLRGSLVLYLPAAAVLLLMVFWMIRVRFAKSWRRNAPA